MGRRSGEAQAALGRKAGPMHHKLKPRGGAKNDQPELLDEDIGWCYEDSIGESGNEECPNGGWLTGNPKFVTCVLCIERFNIKRLA